MKLNETALNKRIKKMTWGQTDEKIIADITRRERVLNEQTHRGYFTSKEQREQVVSNRKMSNPRLQKLYIKPLILLPTQDPRAIQPLLPQEFTSFAPVVAYAAGRVKQGYIPQDKWLVIDMQDRVFSLANKSEYEEIYKSYANLVIVDQRFIVIDADLEDPTFAQIYRNLEFSLSKLSKVEVKKPIAGEDIKFMADLSKVNIDNLTTKEKLAYIEEIKKRTGLKDSDLAPEIVSKIVESKSKDVDPDIEKPDEIIDIEGIKKQVEEEKSAKLIQKVYRRTVGERKALLENNGDVLKSHKDLRLNAMKIRGTVDRYISIIEAIVAGKVSNYFEPTFEGSKPDKDLPTYITQFLLPGNNSPQDLKRQFVKLADNPSQYEEFVANKRIDEVESDVKFMKNLQDLNLILKNNKSNKTLKPKLKSLLGKEKIDKGGDSPVKVVATKPKVEGRRTDPDVAPFEIKEKIN